MKADGFSSFFNGIGRVAIETTPSIFTCLTGSANQITRGVKFGQQAVSSFA